MALYNYAPKVSERIIWKTLMPFCRRNLITIYFNTFIKNFDDLRTTQKLP